MQVQFNLAGKEDIAKVLTMMERFYQIDGYPFNVLLAHANLSTFIANPHLGRLWVIVSDHQVVGYIAFTFGFSFEFGGRDAFLDELFIEEDYRGQGIGTQALAFVIQAAGTLDVKAIHLEVEKHNNRGKELYRKFHFTDHDRHLMTRKIPGL